MAAAASVHRRHPGPHPPAWRRSVRLIRATRTV